LNADPLNGRQGNSEQRPANHGTEQPPNGTTTALRRQEEEQLFGLLATLQEPESKTTQIATPHPTAKKLSLFRGCAVPWLFCSVIRWKRFAVAAPAPHSREADTTISAYLRTGKCRLVLAAPQLLRPCR